MNERTDKIEAEEAARKPWWQQRGWRVTVYGALVAAAPVAIFYGLLTVEEAGVWLALAGAVLGVGGVTAIANYEKR